MDKGMRDPSRLFGLYAKLAQLHSEKCPDMRFIQLMDDFIISLRDESDVDPFYIEDDQVIGLLEKYLQRTSVGTVVNRDSSPLCSSGFSMIPIEQRTGLTCACCGTSKSVKYRFGGHNYCNRCILEARK